VGLWKDWFISEFCARDSDLFLKEDSVSKDGMAHGD
jgi:hypothetical protein